MQHERSSGRRLDETVPTGWIAAHLLFSTSSFSLQKKKKKKKKKKKTSGLDKNGYDKSKCEDFFERYKACKTVEYEARRKARVDARRGRKKEQQPAGG